MMKTTIDSCNIVKTELEFLTPNDFIEKRSNNCYKPSSLDPKSSYRAIGTIKTPPRSRLHKSKTTVNSDLTSLFPQ